MNPMMLMAASALGNGMRPAPTTSTGQLTNTTDNSGWNVNFGGGSIASDRRQAGPGGIDQYMPLILLGVGVLVLWRMTRKS
jgi:hypothetical protein